MIVGNRKVKVSGGLEGIILSFPRITTIEECCTLSRLILPVVLILAAGLLLGMAAGGGLDYLPALGAAGDISDASGIGEGTVHNAAATTLDAPETARGYETPPAAEDKPTPEVEPTYASQGAGPAGVEGSTVAVSGREAPESWWIDVNITEQMVRVYDGDQLVKEMLASTGIADKPTPLGSFKIQNRGEWFFNPKYGQGAKYWVSFKDWGVYLFHSLAMDENQEIIPEEAAKLGQPASHGCIRLEVENACWIYENIPEGTPVEIHL